MFDENKADKKLYVSYDKYLLRKNKGIRFNNMIKKTVLELTNDFSSVTRSYLSILDFYKGKFVERIFAYRKLKNNNKIKKEPKIYYKEVIRVFEGSSVLAIKDIYFTGIGGYNVSWDDNRAAKKHLFNYGKWDYSATGYFNVGVYQLFTLEDAIKFNPEIKYCAYRNKEASLAYITAGNFVGYITRYKAYPVIEILSKFDLLHLMSDTRCLKRMETEKTFIKFLAKNRDLIRIYRINYNMLLKVYKDNLNLKHYITLDDIHKNYNYKANKIELEDKIDSIVKYLEKNNFKISIYFDYYQAAKNFIDMNKYKNLYPNDLLAEHNFYIKKLADNKIEIQQKVYDSVYLKYKKFDFINDKYIIRLPKELTELKHEGQTLNHCVGRMNYDERMLEEKSLIFFIRKRNEEDIPYFTLELNLDNFEVVQVYGLKHSMPCNDLNNLINYWHSLILKTKNRKVA